MRLNFINFTKMQLLGLSKIALLQLLGIAISPIFFNQINRNNDLANTLIYTSVIFMASYIILRNFAFNDEKYKTKLLFSILPVTPTTIIGARGIIIYLFCLAATPLLILFSFVTHAIKPEMYAIVQPHILPYGLLLVATLLPVEFLIFYMFEAQKADIIAALILFPFMGLNAVFYKAFMNNRLWIVTLIIGVFTNVLCFTLSMKLYKKNRGY